MSQAQCKQTTTMSQAQAFLKIQFFKYSGIITIMKKESSKQIRDKSHVKKMLKN